MKKLLFKLLSKVSQSTVDEYITQRWIKPLDLKELNLSFIDTTGKAWYEYPEGMAISMKRMAANLQAYEYLTNRMSPEVFDNLVEDCKEMAAHGKSMEVIVAMVDYQKLRGEVVPFDVLINIIATDFVREDENPKDHNQTIHQEKCNYLKEVIERGDSFFFQLPVVKDLSTRFKISNEGWQIALKGFQEAVKEIKGRRDILHSMNSDKE